MIARRVLKYIYLIVVDSFIDQWREESRYPKPVMRMTWTDFWKLIK